MFAIQFSHQYMSPATRPTKKLHTDLFTSFWMTSWSLRLNTIQMTKVQY